MGYASLVTACFVCGRVFTSNPKKVPSHDGNPICKDCMDIINEKRKEKGMEPFPIHPDAYEACDENEL